MMRTAMVLMAGLTVMAVPALMAQEEQGDGAGMRQGMQHRQMGQRGPAMHLGLDRMIGQLMDRQHELNLTDGQMTELRDLRGEAQSALEPLRDQMATVHEGIRDGSLDREAAHAAMQGLHEQQSGSMEALHKRLGEVLEPEQRAALRHGRSQRARQGARRGRMQRQHGRMQRQHGRMQRQHKQMQERQERQEAPPAPEAPARG